MLFNILKINNLVKKGMEDLNRHFSKDDMQTANKHMKRYSTSLIIREMQIKTEMKHCLIPVKWPSLKSLQITNAGEEKGTLLHCWWESKLVLPLWRTVWQFFKS